MQGTLNVWFFEFSLEPFCALYTIFDVRNFKMPPLSQFLSQFSKFAGSIIIIMLIINYYISIIIRGRGYKLLGFLAICKNVKKYTQL